jgi:hypothetical protein
MFRIGSDLREVSLLLLKAETRYVGIRMECEYGVRPGGMPYYN